MNPKLKPLVKAINRAPFCDPLAPWRKIAKIAVGGLTSVGFSREAELLLVVSTQGRSVIDCNTGEVVERDRSEYEESYSNLVAEGVGVMCDEQVRITGMYGGGVANLTQDMWMCHELVLEFPESTLMLVEPGSWLYGSLYGQRGDFIKIGSALELRAFGFSPTGQTLLIATSSDLTIYNRN